MSGTGGHGLGMDDWSGVRVAFGGGRWDGGRLWRTVFRSFCYVMLCYIGENRIRSDGKAALQKAEEGRIGFELKL